MSIKNVHAFYDNVMENQELQSQLRGVPRNNGEGVVSIARSIGYDFSINDLNAVLEQRRKDSSKEISDTLTKLGLIEKRCCHRAENSIRN